MKSFWGRRTRCSLVRPAWRAGNVCTQSPEHKAVSQSALSVPVPLISEGLSSPRSKRVLAAALALAMQQGAGAAGSWGSGHCNCARQFLFPGSPAPHSQELSQSIVLLGDRKAHNTFSRFSLKTCQGLEMLLRAGAKGQHFGTQVPAEREETTAVEGVS